MQTNKIPNEINNNRTNKTGFYCYRVFRRRRFSVVKLNIVATSDKRERFHSINLMLDKRNSFAIFSFI